MKRSLTGRYENGAMEVVREDFTDLRTGDLVRVVSGLIYRI